ncbi:hypothetical protein E2C01_084858 [Portunus trituberculatus]|uniref:Uncharacterized protein n=1 Tax=Portunus trituberculatus TaxID=210409 RepID=A0A5B7J543_PORTR|nr:hypothetical protein [Portunus trituberculatus]
MTQDDPNFEGRPARMTASTQPYCCCGCTLAVHDNHRWWESSSGPAASPRHTCRLPPAPHLPQPSSHLHHKCSTTRLRSNDGSSCNYTIVNGKRV